MKLDYTLQTNSATIAGKLAWSTPFQITNASVDRVTQYLRLAATGAIDITLDLSALN